MYTIHNNCSNIYVVQHHIDTQKNTTFWHKATLPRCCMSRCVVSHRVETSAAFTCSLPLTSVSETARALSPSVTWRNQHIPADDDEVWFSRVVEPMFYIMHMAHINTIYCAARARLNTQTLSFCLSEAMSSVLCCSHSNNCHATAPSALRLYSLVCLFVYSFAHSLFSTQPQYSSVSFGRSK